MAGAGAAPGGLRRWRWRRSGAWMWPAFAVALIVDVVLVLELPPSGAQASGVEAFVIAGAANLIAVAVAAPLAGLWLRRRRPDLPRVVARDSAGTAVLVALVAVFVGAGLANRSAVTGDQAAFRAQSDAMRRYVIDQAPVQYRRHLGQADSVRLGGGLYRTCVPGDDPARALCLFIDTSQSPPGVRLDSDAAPNVRYFNRRPDAFQSG